MWEKYTNLFSHVDSERERFLGFERWWGSFYFLSREEILAIIGNLFVGNRLEQGTLRICDGCFADLRRSAIRLSSSPRPATTLLRLIRRWDGFPSSTRIPRI